jgi:hypothetical protein
MLLELKVLLKIPMKTNTGYKQATVRYKIHQAQLFNIIIYFRLTLFICVASQLYYFEIEILAGHKRVYLNTIKKMCSIFLFECIFF